MNLRAPIRRFPTQCSPGRCERLVVGELAGYSWTVSRLYGRLLFWWRCTVKKDRASARSLEIEFEAGLREEVTAHAGVALLVETGRRSGVIATTDRVLPAKRNPKGLAQGQMVESLVVLSALGGECLDDFQKLREDQGLEAMVGYELPAPSTVRGWLEQCHDDEAMAERPLQGSFIPRESARLAGLR